MSGILDSVNQRTQLVGQNRLELLLFRLNGRQRFGINVFKVREVLQCPPLTSMPKLNKLVRGVAHMGLGLVGRLAPEKMLRQFDWLYGYDVTKAALQDPSRP